MFYLIYRITNIINGKIYIGSHKTYNKEDGYMGSGKYLLYAQRKYGIENFTKDILFVYDNANEMYAKEAEIVNDEFIAEENTYNLKRGGFGGFDYLNSDRFNNPTHSFEHMSKMSSRSAGFKGKAHTVNTRSVIGTKAAMRQALNGGGFTGRSHSDKTLAKMRQPKNIGTANSQFGTIWITDGTVNKKTNKDSVLPSGWYRGRTLYKQG